MGDSGGLSSEPGSLSHLNSRGEVHIVDISQKAPTARIAVAETWVRMKASTYSALASGETPKGDVLATTRLAAIMACKKTSELVPLCHPLPVEAATCDIQMKGEGAVRIEVTVTTSGKTGVEMEALTGASVAALTLYDMMKALDKSMTIGPTQLLRKEGGKSGTYLREVAKTDE